MNYNQELLIGISTLSNRFDETLYNYRLLNYKLDSIIGRYSSSYYRTIL